MRYFNLNSSKSDFRTEENCNLVVPDKPPCSTDACLSLSMLATMIEAFVLYA
jgi:hypothetical protein